MTTLALACEGLAVTVGGREVLHALDLEVRRGVVCGVLGANGSGKTTLLKALTGLLPHTGSVRWDGRLLRAPGTTSLGLQGSGLHPKRRTRDHVRFLRMSGCVDDVVLDRLTAQLGLGPLLRATPDDMSFGQRQALSVLGPLAATARTYLLDEPFAGLDAARVQVVRDRVLELRRAGATVLITSHDLAPVEGVLEQVVLLDRGALRFSGPKQAFVQHCGDSVVAVVADDEAGLRRFLDTTVIGGSVVPGPPGEVAVAHTDYRQVLRCLADCPVAIRSVVVDASPLQTALTSRLASGPTELQLEGAAP